MRLTKFFLFAFLVVATTGCGIFDFPTVTQPKDDTSDEPKDKEVVVSTENGKASYYADKFHGRTTASGEKYDKNKMTAAHKKLPFGTRVRVTNKTNGKTIIVRINDRGPFVKGRIIDLSRAAATKVDMIRAGVVDVKMEVLR
ncbi:MAG: septal ring lytic transglycosylase RlpA family protein [Bacteroidota bacterium]